MPLLASRRLVALLVLIVSPEAVRRRHRAPGLREGIESVLRKKVGELLRAEGRDGVSKKRGTYSKSFRKIDDATYAARFTSTRSSRRRTTRSPTGSAPSGMSSR